MEKIEQVIAEREKKIDFLTQRIKDDFHTLEEMDIQLAYFKDLKERMKNE